MKYTIQKELTMFHAGAALDNAAAVVLDAVAGDSVVVVRVVVVAD